MTKKLYNSLKEQGWKKGQVLHKACGWRFNYASCDPLCRHHYYWVVSNWNNVTCAKCLKHKK